MNATPSPSSPPLLKVYACLPTYAYSGGVLLIAAPTLKAARRLFATTTYGKSALGCASLSDPKLDRSLLARGKARVLMDNVYIE